MMIQAEYWTTDELDENGDVRVDLDGIPEYTGFNARVVDHPEVNASASNISGGAAAMRQHLVDAWNRTFPGDPKTMDDFTFTETDNRW